jgi:hypothetical protein
MISSGVLGAFAKETLSRHFSLF